MKDAKHLAVKMGRLVFGLRRAEDWQHISRLGALKEGMIVTAA